MNFRWEKKIRKTDPTAPPPAQPGTPPSAVVYKPYKNEMVCHGASSVPTELKQKTRVRVVGEFDVDCTLRFPGKLYEKMTLKLRRQPGKICPEWQGKCVQLGIPYFNAIHCVVIVTFGFKQNDV